MHVLAHEAGHAVAAIDFGIPFRAVALYDETNAPLFGNGLFYAPGAVEMGTEDASEWVLPNIEGSLRFILGGVTAEQAVLGHPIEGGFDEDMRLWRVGTKRFDGQSVDELTEFIGKPLLDVYQEMREWATESRDRIVALGEHLGRQMPPFEMSEDEVRAFLAGL